MSYSEITVVTRAIGFTWTTQESCRPGLALVDPGVAIGAVVTPRHSAGCGTSNIGAIAACSKPAAGGACRALRESAYGYVSCCRSSTVVQSLPRFDHTCLWGYYERALLVVDRGLTRT